MIFKGKVIKKISKHGTEFLAMEINSDNLIEYLKKLEKYIGTQKFYHITESKCIRDGKSYHITVVPPHQMKNINYIADNKDYLVECIGIGSLNYEVYFLVITSNDLNRLRESFGLELFDFHITLGFDVHDIHSQRKDESTLVSALN